MAKPDPAPAIDATDVARRFGRRWAVAGVSLRVPRGTRLMLTGRNGSGKSTLLRVLATASRIDHGEARIEGFDLRRERDEVRRRVALLGHHSHLYEALSARENLEIVRRFLGAPAERVAAALAEVGLAERADDPVLVFSAGMRKRLALARALLQDARVLLLDEPYGELDPAGFALLDRTLDEQKRRGVTVVLATHLLAHGRELCDEAVALDDGRVVWSGPARDLPEPGAA